MAKTYCDYLKIITFTIVASFLVILFFIPPTKAFAVDSTSDNIYIFSMSSDGTSSLGSDMILVESNGHYGLIDASNNSFTELNGQYLSPYAGLSDSVNNGVNNARFMIDTMGVDHLDFIIGTHSHSDHIGGISEIADLEYNGVKLVDENTVYFYKDYKSINSREDDYWHNGDFSGLAIDSMTRNGALTLSVNNGLDYEKAEAINSIGAFSNIWINGDSGSLDDFISFQFGDFNFRLYNLYHSYPCTTENDNCIVTLITKGSQRILLLADITNENSIGARLSSVISNHIGGARINLLKDAHHGTPYGSNTKEEAQNYRPVIDISSKDWGDSKPYNNFGNFKYYCERYYGTKFYAAGDADRAVAAVINENSIDVFNLTSSGSFTGMPANTRHVADGWQIWDEGRGYSWDPENVGVKKWYYYKNGVPVTGWQKINNKWYWFEQDGEMRTSWIKSSGKWYYLTENGLATGWEYADGNWYYLDSSGIMQTGWLKLGGTWYFLKSSGEMAIGWEKVNGAWYYFNSSGAMTTGWQYVDGNWYYMNSSGAMITGWLQSGGKWYFLNSSGSMSVGWKKVNGSWYYFDNSGVMQTGWQYVDGEWFYLSGSGAMLTGWQNIGGTEYYLKSSGAMAANEYISGYWLNKDGSWTYQYRATWRKNSTGWWYGDATGWYAKNGTYKIDGVYYSFDSNGYLR